MDGSRIIFADQHAKIVDDRTLVPARGVFEAMGCTVVWNGEKRTVEVTSDTGVQNVLITIDSDKMRISRFKSIREREQKEVTIDVAARIMNDRTMIPLRAVSEAFNSKVEWDADNYRVVIETGDPILLEGYTYTAPEEDSLVRMSLSTDKTGALEAGEEFTVYVDVENVPDDAFCSSVVVTFDYDVSQFEYVPESKALLNNDGEIISGALSVENTIDGLGTKIVSVTIDGDNASRKSGHVLKVSFKSVNGDKGEIGIADSYETGRGYSSYLLYTTVKDGKYNDTKYNGKDLIIGDPITIGE
ncbi:MAG: hypothetical protein IJH94_05355 [Clostridia bacterium]|nr:hypothetical protein [Clostridia bacterium]